MKFGRETIEAGWTKRSGSFRVKKVREGVECPNCHDVAHIETSSYEQADYYCAGCRCWFSKEENPRHAPFGDALERLVV